jgi:hypothetical protein
MKIYNINLNLNPFEPACAQLVDLDRIVSITPISVRNYTGYEFGISHADFHIYIDMGCPVLVRFKSGTMLPFPEDVLLRAKAEQEKLISAWKNES